MGDFATKPTELSKSFIDDELGVHYGEGVNVAFGENRIFNSQYSRV